MAVAQINLAGNQLCGLYEDLFGDVQGTYTAEGIKAIADSIAVTASMTSIDLRDNGFGPGGAKALAPALRDSPSLTSINLQYNSMGEEGKVLLRKAVEGRAGFELLL